jgi:hypothetical protein
MDELLKKLLEANILTEDTKVELEAAFQTQLDEAREVVKAETAETVRAELTEQWITERDQLIEAVETKVNVFLGREISELQEDISRFRDLEAEAAEKLVEAKEEMAVALQSDMTQLVEKLNTFLEMRLTAELDELKDDLQEAKTLQFGREIFEGFVKEYRTSFVNEDGVEAELAESRQRLADTEARLEEAQSKIDKAARDTKLATLLQPLEGKQRDVMESILTNVATADLEEGYKTFIGRVLKESQVTESQSTEEKEDKVLAEGETEGQKQEEANLVTVTGDTEQTLEESTVVEAPADYSQLRKLAGL